VVAWLLVAPPGGDEGRAALAAALVTRRMFIAARTRRVPHLCTDACERVFDVEAGADPDVGDAGIAIARPIAIRYDGLSAVRPGRDCRLLFKLVCSSGSADRSASLSESS
jgi:hypothetical protein